MGIVIKRWLGDIPKISELEKLTIAAAARVAGVGMDELSRSVKQQQKKGCAMKYIKYFFYILAHKWNILIECWKTGLYWHGITHDTMKRIKIK